MIARATSSSLISFNHRIRKVATNGTITTAAGTGVPGFSGDNGPAVNAQINTPTGVFADASGNLYIADVGNQRIRKVDGLGIITTLAGNGVKGYGFSTANFSWGKRTCVVLIRRQSRKTRRIIT